MATLITTRKGKKVVLLNPAERGKRYSRELANGRKHDGTPLTDTEAAFRMGVLNERKTQAKIFKKNKAKAEREERRKTINALYKRY